jgi:hypothetical protein
MRMRRDEQDARPVWRVVDAYPDGHDAFCNLLFSFLLSHARMCCTRARILGANRVRAALFQARQAPADGQAAHRRTDLQISPELDRCEPEARELSLRLITADCAEAERSKVRKS